VCPSPAHTLWYVAALVEPPQYPTRVFVMPRTEENCWSGPQNQPMPNTAKLLLAWAAPAMDEKVRRNVTEL